MRRTDYNSTQDRHQCTLQVHVRGYGLVGVLRGCSMDRMRPCSKYPYSLAASTLKFGPASSNVLSCKTGRLSTLVGGSFEMHRTDPFCVKTKPCVGKRRDAERRRCEMSQIMWCYAEARNSKENLGNNAIDLTLLMEIHTL